MSVLGGIGKAYKSFRTGRRSARNVRRAEQRLRHQQTLLDTETTKFRREAVAVRGALLATHKAAEKNRLTDDWKATTKSADDAIIQDSETLNARARAAVRDTWIGASAVRSFRRNVVGKDGITVRSAARDPKTGKAYDEFNAGADRWWKWWGRDKLVCDIERRKTFRQLEQLVVSELRTVGEAFAIPIYKKQANMVGLMIQMFAPEQLDTTLSRAPGGKNEIRGGIEIDKMGAAVAYHVKTVDYKSVRIPGERVIHVFDQQRVRQTRGVTPFRPVLVKAHHLGSYDEYQLICARLEACIGGAIRTDSATNDDDIGLALESGESSQDSYGSEQIVMEPGMMPRLNAGESIDWNNPTRPGASYEKFSQAQMGMIAAGLGLDFAALTRDYSKGNFSSQRQGMLECNREFDDLLQLMIEDFCVPVRQMFKMLCILEGRIAAPGFLDDAEMRLIYLEDEWQGPARPWIDPLKAARAYEVAVKNRFMTRREVMNEQGRSIEDDLKQHADEQELAKELGVYLPDAEPPRPVAPAEPPAEPEKEPKKPAE